jgi:hypothetical protein
MTEGQGCIHRSFGSTPGETMERLQKAERRVASVEGTELLARAVNRLDNNGIWDDAQGPCLLEVDDLGEREKHLGSISEVQAFSDGGKLTCVRPKKPEEKHTWFFVMYMAPGYAMPSLKEQSKAGR